jgi:hypothetical protein
MMRLQYLKDLVADENYGGLCDFFKVLYRIEECRSRSLIEVVNNKKDRTPVPQVAMALAYTEEDLDGVARIVGYHERNVDVWYTSRAYQATVNKFTAMMKSEGLEKFL